LHRGRAILLLWVPVVFSLLTPSLLSPSALGAAGDLDTTFSGDGVVQRRFDGMATSIAAVEHAPHHRFLVAANVGCCGGQDVAIVRLHSDAAPDTAFGDGGLVVVDTGETDRVISMVRDAEGRIVLVGYRQLFGASCAFEVCINMLLARFRAGGAPDPSFGDGGVLTVDSPFDRQPVDAAIDDEGRVVVTALFEQEDETDRAVVVRFLDDGSLDPGFGLDGVVELPRATTLWPGGVAIDREGRVVVVGTTFDLRPAGSPLATRLLPSGEPDTSFSGDGTLALESWPGAGETDGAGLNEVAIDSRGRILAAGYHSTPEEFRLAVVRVAIAGHLHAVFSGDGVVTLDPERQAGSISWIGSDSRGRILFAGTAMGIALWDVLVGRIRPNGVPDPSFGGAGVIKTNVDPYQDQTNDAFIGGRDRLVVAGSTDDGVAGEFGLLLRYLAE
jgi:uncharacterized delta-60 repeat protein